MQLDLDLDAAVHPTAAFGGANFSPDISETQKVVASPRSSHVHTKKDDDENGKAGNTVFDRLYKDKEQRERRLTLEKVRIKKEVEKDLTFQPQTNIKHDDRKKKRMSKKKGSDKKETARQCQTCLERSIVKQTKEVVVGEESAAALLEKDLRLDDEEHEDEEINGPLLEPGDTFAALAAARPQ